LNPPEWTERVPEVIPLGMEKSPYPERILPRVYLSQRDLAELKRRTLTNLYNQRPLGFPMHTRRLISPSPRPTVGRVSGPR
jgi:hypothetical protein